MHTAMIAILAEVGKTQGYEIWIGRREQRDRLSEAFPNREGELREYLSRTSLSDVKNLQSIEDVEFIDILWLEGNFVKAAFEIEATTSMTEALKRGSNIDPTVPKYLVIPQDREDQLLRKLRSPLFGERFEKDSWKCLFFETLEAAFQKQKGKLDLASLVAKKISKPSGKNTDQLSLFAHPPPVEDDNTSDDL